MTSIPPDKPTRADHVIAFAAATVICTLGTVLAIRFVPWYKGEIGR